MGYFTSNPIAVNDPSELGDLLSNAENAIELKRSFGRYHSFDLSGANNGKHTSLAYYSCSGSTEIVAARATNPRILDTTLAALFDGSIWELTLAVSMKVPQEGTRLGHISAVWAGAPLATTWKALQLITPDNGGSPTAYNYGICIGTGTNSEFGSVSTTESGFSETNLVAVVGLVSTPRLVVALTSPTATASVSVARLDWQWALCRICA